VGDVQVEHVEERPRVGMAFLVLDLTASTVNSTTTTRRGKNN
jgi:hypothetical protein